MIFVEISTKYNLYLGNCIKEVFMDFLEVELYYNWS